MQESTGALSFTELILNASFLVQVVMAFLLVLSLVSWTIIIQRSNQYKVGRQKADEFEDKFWSGIDLNNLYQDCMSRQQSLVGLEVIYAAGFKEFVRLVNSGPADQEVVMDGTYRQMKVATSREVESLESHLPTLATIGSISPYIGLFGTVWGIMHAFVALAAVKNATLSMVAPPIAEALIATAMGLFAAIPAVMFYNRFVTKVEALENRYLNFMDEFSTILNRRLVTIRSQISKGQEQHNVVQNANANNVASQMQAQQMQVQQMQQMQNAQAQQVAAQNAPQAQTTNTANANMGNVNKAKVSNVQMQAQQIQQHMQTLNLQQVPINSNVNKSPVNKSLNKVQKAAANPSAQAQIASQTQMQYQNQGKGKTTPYTQQNMRYANAQNKGGNGQDEVKAKSLNAKRSMSSLNIKDQNNAKKGLLNESVVHDTQNSFLESDPSNKGYNQSSDGLNASKNNEQKGYNEPESPYISPGGQNHR